MRRRRRTRAAPPKARRPLAFFRSRLGHRFRKLDLLERALTHGSYAHDHGVGDYERLEFVGDAALGLAVTEIFYFACPDWTLHRRQEAKSAIVNNESLAAAARTLQLPDGLRVGAGQGGEQGARSSDRILANVFEAVLGAAWLDGGLDGVRGVVRTAFDDRFESFGADPDAGPGRRSPRRLYFAAIRIVRRVLGLATPVERAMGRAFGDREPLRAAEHASPRRSWRRRGRRPRRPREERGDGGAQRFLGRDVLHLVIADALHARFPDWDEGRMTLARMRLLERDFLVRIGGAWNVEAGESRAAVVEGLLGALLLDGGLAAAKKALAPVMRPALDDLEDPNLELLDAKTLLQNRIAKAGGEPPRYREVSRPGRGHAAVVLRLADGKTFQGTGRGVKDAEKDAAAQAFRRLYSAARPDKKERPCKPSDAAPRSENPKGALQELVAKEQREVPTYRVLAEEGPEHDKTFHVEVLVAGRALARGRGPSKRRAEAEAAAAALDARR